MRADFGAAWRGGWIAGVLALAVAWPTAPVAAERFVVDPAHTFPTFEVSHLGFSMHRGRFNRTRGTLELDVPAKRGVVDIEIEVASLDTGDEALEKELRSENFFDVARHATLSFHADRLVFDGDRLTALHGVLTMHGVSRPLSLDVDHFRCGQNPAIKKFVCGANARTTLRRSEFGMARFVPFIGDEVAITIQVEATRE